MAVRGGAGGGAAALGVADVWLCAAQDDGTADELKRGLESHATSVSTSPEGCRRAVVVLSPPLARADPPELREWVHERGEATLILTLAAGRAEWDERADRFFDDSDAVPPSLARAFRSRPIVLDLRGADRERFDRIARRLAGATSSPGPAVTEAAAPPRVWPGAAGAPPRPVAPPASPPAPAAAAPPPPAPAAASPPAPPRGRTDRRRGVRRVAVILLFVALVVIPAALVVRSGGRETSVEVTLPPDTGADETSVTGPRPSTPTTRVPLPGGPTVVPTSRPLLTLPHTTTAPTITSPAPAPPTTAAPETPAASHRAALVWVTVGVIALAIGIVIGVRLGRTRSRGNAAPRPEPPPPDDTAAVSPPPAAPAATQVFISHDTDADGHVARTLAAQLTAHRLRPWLAPDSIPPGEEWVFAIERGLTTSKAAVILLSPAALASGWVRKEIQIIVDLEIAGRLYVVPVRVAPCDVPLVLNAYQWVDVGNFGRAAEELSRRFPLATEA
jgi:hypothetical protein